MNYQPMTIAYKRTILARMLQDSWTTKRHVKLKDTIVEVNEEASLAMLVRIIELDTKLAALEKKEQQAQQKLHAAPMQPQAAQEAPEQLEVVQEAVATTPRAEQPATPPQAKTTKPGHPPKQETYKEMQRRKNRERMAAKLQEMGKGQSA